MNNVKTELKTLENHNLNTPLKKIRKAFDKQGAEYVIYNLRKCDATLNDAEIIYQRILGIYNGELPGILEFWTIEGKVTYLP